MDRRFLSHRLNPQSNRPLPRRVRTADSRVRRIFRRFVEYVANRGRKGLIRDGAIGLGAFLVLFFLYIWITLPDISDPKSLTAAQSSVILDHNGTELYRLFREEDRVYIPDDQIPEHLKKAIVAIEDQRFYSRGCIDVRALARTVLTLGRGGGASTLTRQLARNAMDLLHENILSRKIKELVLGCQLEGRYSKEELLSLYLNWIPLGKNAYGVGLASRTYFGKEVKDLTLPESAILAALPQAPSYYSPYGKHVRTVVSADAYAKILSGRIRNADDLNDDDFTIGLLGARAGTGSTTIYVGGRTDQVLASMEEQGFITEKERDDAVLALATMTFKQSRENIRAPHFVLWVRQQVTALLGGAEEGILDQGGLTIETTLDWDMQQAAEKAIAKDHENIGRVYQAHNAALLSVEPVTGEIRAYVGNADYNDEEFSGKVDMARAPRQPGSSFKPLVYASAFEHGAGPATVLFDVPTKIGTDTPQNFDGTFWGLTTARKAIAGSRNIPAIKAFFVAGGEQNVLELATRVGAPSPAQQKNALSGSGGTSFEYGWPLAIGAAETPLTEMVQAYATFANGGKLSPIFGIKQIRDKRGNILYDAAQHHDEVQAMDARVAYEITSMLSDVAARPNEYWQQVLSVPGYAAAAKTGTSNKCLDRAESGNCKDRKPSDLWTIGYTPNLVTGVWVGNADSKPLAEKAESLSIASPIWKDYMTRAHKFVKDAKTAFIQPPNMVQPQVSLLSGQLPTECTPVQSRAGDVFLAENAPTLADPACAQLLIDKVTGLLASDECPAEATEMRSFFIPTSVLGDRFPQWQQSVEEWAKNESKKYDPVTGTFSGSSLPLPMAPTEKCKLSLTPGRLEKPSITLDVPTKGGMVSYPSFQPQWTVKAGSKIREISVELDGKKVASATEAPFTITVRAPRSMSKDGTHSIKVIITDQYYNTASDEGTFTFGEDKSGPTVRLLEPADQATLPADSPLTITASATDSEGGIKYVEFFMDDTLLTTKPKEPYSLTFEHPAPGGHIIRAVATDLAGNKESDQVSITVEP